MAGNSVPSLAHALCRQFVRGEGELAGVLQIRMEAGEFQRAQHHYFSRIQCNRVLHTHFSRVQLPHGFALPWYTAAIHICIETCQCCNAFRVGAGFSRHGMGSCDSLTHDGSWGRIIWLSMYVRAYVCILPCLASLQNATHPGCSNTASVSWEGKTIHAAIIHTPNYIP